MPHTILLYYKYVHIDNPELFRDEQRALCEKLGLKGRIIVAAEGINGTVEGLTENTEKYIEIMQKDARFADVDFKKSVGDGKAFPKLSIKARKEIVTLGTGTADVSNGLKSGAYISPDDLQKLYDEKKDFVVIDMRNDYEYAVGHFENSVTLPVKNFKDIPEEIKKIENKLKDKKVVSVCTGGVRCEKATGYLLERGFKDVYQLEGGMVRYLEKHPGKKFKGSLYVFDGRKVVSYDDPNNHEVVGKCFHCAKPCEQYENCQNRNCNIHFICCDECKKGDYYCSATCKEKVERGIKIATLPTQGISTPVVK